MIGGLAEAEFRGRLARAQAMMADAGLAGLLLTTEPDLRYFSGFLTRFWESPCRPWFLVVPAAGDPVAVIPEIGAPLMARGWIADIRSWPAPDPEDDGVSLLAATLDELAGGGEVGLPSGPQSHLRMPLADFERLRGLTRARLRDDAGLLRALRMVKSDAEIALIREACTIAGRAFDRVPELARPGLPMAALFRGFQRLCLEEGADQVGYLAGGAGPLGYDDVISPATEAPLSEGDVVMLDTGVVHRGYYCDFDRNWALGHAAPEARAAHARCREATEAGLAAARPGATAAELFHAMDAVLTGGTSGAGAGRLGHGLGMQLTEWPSLTPRDHTVLAPGMVLTLEPGTVGTAGPGGAQLVHEENIVIRETGPELLTPRAPPDLPVIG